MTNTQNTTDSEMANKGWTKIAAGMWRGAVPNPNQIQAYLAQNPKSAAAVTAFSLRLKLKLAINHLKALQEAGAHFEAIAKAQEKVLSAQKEVFNISVE